MSVFLMPTVHFFEWYWYNTANFNVYVEPTFGEISSVCCGDMGFGLEWL